MSNSARRFAVRQHRPNAPPPAVSPRTILFELLVVAGIIVLYARYPWRASNVLRFSVAAGRGLTAAELSAAERLNASWDAGANIASGGLEEGGADDSAGGKVSFEAGRVNDGGALEADAKTRQHARVERPPIVVERSVIRPKAAEPAAAAAAAAPLPSVTLENPPALAPIPVPVALPVPIPIPGHVGVKESIGTAAAEFSFGGGVTLPAVAWGAAQDSVDCVTRQGSWEERAELQLLFERPSVNADSASEFCSEAPFNRTLDPSFWYTWAPFVGGASRNCALPEKWSRLSFCEALAGREIFLVGDSLTFTFHETLLSALLDPLDPELHEHSQWDTCPTHTLCASEARAAPDRVKPGTLRYIRNDHATVAFSGKNPARNENMWTDALTENSLLVINRGAHFVPDEELIQGVQTTITWIEKEAPRGMGVIWRNTVPGHELEDFLYKGEYERFKTPLQRRHKYKENDKAAKYNWNLFPAQNAIVEGLVRAHMEKLSQEGNGGIGWLYLDVENSTVLRADRHKDGLHYCVPGPTDTWVRFLEFAMRTVSGL